MKPLTFKTNQIEKTTPPLHSFTLLYRFSIPHAKISPSEEHHHPTVTPLSHNSLPTSFLNTFLNHVQRPNRIITQSNQQPNLPNLTNGHVPWRPAETQITENSIQTIPSGTHQRQTNIPTRSTSRRRPNCMAKPNRFTP